MARGVFDKELLDFTCPQCNHSTRKSVAWFKAHPTFTCTRCGENVTLNQDEFARGVKKIENQIDKAVSDIDRAFKRMK